MSAADASMAAAPIADTIDGAATDAAAPSSGVSFKKKGSKRKEFRAPAASLASRTDAALLAPDAKPAALQPVPSNEEATAAEATTAQAVSVEDDTRNDADALPSAATTATAAAALPVARPAAATVDDDDDADSSDDDDGAPRRSIALSAADAAAAAAAIEEEEPEGVDDAVDGVQRPSKRTKHENPLLASTRNKLKKDSGGFTIASTRSAMPDNRMADKQVTMDISSDPARQVARDPNKPKWSGPAKPQAANVRVISRFDYQPDICKDYKETGRCGYGDSCKFMHDRGDYKAGWQLERDWAAEQEVKRKRMLQGLPAEDVKVETVEQLPWACDICRQPFVNPVVTKCKHYFCEKCALDHYVKDTKCFSCRKPTSGIFNTASDLIVVLKKRVAAGVDPRAELEKAERARLAEKAAATGASLA